MHRFVAIPLFFMLFGATTFCADIQEKNLTYEWLSTNGYTDHVPAFKVLFKHEKINSFLEFGLGLGTKYFIDNCKSVTSIELIGDSSTSRTLPWFVKTKQMLQHHKNWKPILYPISPLMDSYDKNYRAGAITPVSKAYLQDVESICAYAIKLTNADLVFIDQGILPRGHFVSCLFDKVDIIAAHDTVLHDAKIHGYDAITQHPNYVRIDYKTGCGVSFWIRKDKQDLIKHLQEAFK